MAGVIKLVAVADFLWISLRTILWVRSIGWCDQRYSSYISFWFWDRNESSMYLAYCGLSVGTICPAPATDQNVIPSSSQTIPAKLLPPSMDHGLQFFLTLAPKSLRYCFSQYSVPWMGTIASKSPEK